MSVANWPPLGRLKREMGLDNRHGYRLWSIVALIILADWSEADTDRALAGTNQHSAARAKRIIELWAAGHRSSGLPLDLEVAS